MTAAERIAELKRERDSARATAVALEQQLARVEALLHRGTGVDTMPTMPGGGRDTSWWYRYLGELDNAWRNRLHAALDPEATP